ncbi:hypothetical protein Tco_0306204 [Tanacetum coccineum]
MTNQTPLYGLLSQTHPYRVKPQQNAPAVVAAVVAAKVGAAAVGDGNGWRCAWADDGGGVMVGCGVAAAGGVDGGVDGGCGAAAAERGGSGDDVWRGCDGCGGSVVMAAVAGQPW